MLYVDHFISKQFLVEFNFLVKIFKSKFNQKMKKKNSNCFDFDLKRNF